MQNLSDSQNLGFRGSTICDPDVTIIEAPIGLKKPSKKRNSYNRISDDVRIQILHATQSGETLKAVAKRLGVNYSSAKSILHTYRKEGRICRKGKPSKANPNQIITIDVKEEEEGNDTQYQYSLFQANGFEKQAQSLQQLSLQSQLQFQQLTGGNKKNKATTPKNAKNQPQQQQQQQLCQRSYNASTNASQSIFPDYIDRDDFFQGGQDLYYRNGHRTDPWEIAECKSPDFFFVKEESILVKEEFDFDNQGDSRGFRRMNDDLCYKWPGHEQTSSPYIKEEWVPDLSKPISTDAAFQPNRLCISCFEYLRSLNNIPASLLATITNH